LVRVPPRRQTARRAGPLRNRLLRNWLLDDSLLAVRSVAPRCECHAHGPHDHSNNDDDNEKPNQRVERAGNVQHDEINLLTNGGPKSPPQGWATNTLLGDQPNAAIGRRRRARVPLQATSGQPPEKSAGQSRCLSIGRVGAVPWCDREDLPPGEDAASQHMRPRRFQPAVLGNV
jgi:hypothetical protein